MLTRDFVEAKGNVSFILRDKNGNIKETQKENLVMRVGFAYIATRMFNSAVSIVNYMEVGTSNSSNDAAQTALLGPFGTPARVTCSSVISYMKTYPNDSVEYTATFPPGTGTGALVEAGLFNNTVGGTMLARTIFNVINKGAEDSLTITWRITIS